MKHILLFLILMTNTFYGFTQTADSIKYKEAYELYGHQDYLNSLKLFSGLHNRLKKSDSLYLKCSYGIGGCLRYLDESEQLKNNWQKVIDYSFQYLDLLEKDKDVLPVEIQNNNYLVYEKLIVAYFGLDQKEDARKFQKKLYDAYKAGLLPGGINKKYNYEQFVCNNVNVYGYEYFLNPLDQASDDDFTKIEMYLYQRDDNGKDVGLIATFNWLKDDKDNTNKNYTLISRVYEKDQEIDNEYTSFKINSKVDTYTNMHVAVSDILKGNLSTSMESIIRR